MLSTSQGWAIHVSANKNLMGENKIHLQHVTLGRDFGTEIEILDGLKDGENIIDNPSDSLQEGQEVQITSAQKH